MDGGLQARDERQAADARPASGSRPRLSLVVVVGLVLLGGAAISQYAVAPAGGPGFNYLALILLLGAIGTFIGAGVADTLDEPWPSS